MWSRKCRVGCQDFTSNRSIDKKAKKHVTHWVGDRPRDRARVRSNQPQKFRCEICTPRGPGAKPRQSLPALFIPFLPNCLVGLPTHTTLSKVPVSQTLTDSSDRTNGRSCRVDQSQDLLLPRPGRSRNITSHAQPALRHVAPVAPLGAGIRLPQCGRHRRRPGRSPLRRRRAAANAAVAGCSEAQPV